MCDIPIFFPLISWLLASKEKQKQDLRVKFFGGNVPL